MQSTYVLLVTKRIGLNLAEFVVHYFTNDVGYVIKKTEF